MVIICLTLKGTMSVLFIHVKPFKFITYSIQTTSYPMNAYSIIMNKSK